MNPFNIKLKTWQDKFSLGILVFVVAFHAILLFPEIFYQSPDLNDNVFHYGLCVSIDEEVSNLGNPIDHWVPYWSMGFPVFHHYQNFPHLVVVSIYRAFFKLIPMFFIYHLIAYLLLVLYPLVLYYSLRKMKFSTISSAFAALFSLALSNINGYGFELNSFIWRGSGMLSQLWAMFLLPLTLSSVNETLQENKNYFRSVIFLFLITLSQLMFGLTAILTCSLFVFINSNFEQIREKLKRFSVILLFFFLLFAYMLIPVMVDSPYHAHSTYDFPEKWDSYGMKYIVTQFLNGNILDYGRLAIVTFLTILGLIFSLSRKDLQYRFAAFGFILWLLLYFGRPTWGGLLDIFPLSSAMHLHRFIAMVHFFSVILAGVGLSLIFELIKKRFKLIAAILLIIVIAAPVFWDRYQFIIPNNKWLIDNKVAYEKEKIDFNAMLDFIKKAPPGRVYPGRRANWGSDFKIGATSVFYFLGIEKVPSLSFLPFSWALSADFTENFNEFRQSHYNLFNLKYYLTEEGKGVPDFAREIFKSGRFKLYEIQTTGYFDMVDSQLAFYGGKNSIWDLFILWMRSSMVDNKQFISVFFDRKFHPDYGNYFYLLDRWKMLVLDPNKMFGAKIEMSKDAQSVDIFSIKPLLDGNIYTFANPGIVISEAPGKNIYSAKVEAYRDCFVLFKMTYHPLWHAYVDGVEKEKVILSPGFIGIKLPKGVHEVKFVYRAQWWKTLLLFVGLIAAIFLFIYERKIK